MGVEGLDFAFSCVDFKGTRDGVVYGVLVHTGSPPKHLNLLVPLWQSPGLGLYPFVFVERCL